MLGCYLCLRTTHQTPRHQSHHTPASRFRVNRKTPLILYHSATFQLVHEAAVDQRPWSYLRCAARARASRFRAQNMHRDGLFASWALRSFIVLMLRDGSSSLFSPCSQAARPCSQAARPCSQAARPCSRDLRFIPDSSSLCHGPSRPRPRPFRRRAQG